MTKGQLAIVAVGVLLVALLVILGRSGSTLQPSSSIRSDNATVAGSPSDSAPPHAVQGRREIGNGEHSGGDKRVPENSQGADGHSSDGGSIETADQGRVPRHAAATSVGRNLPPYAARKPDDQINADAPSPPNAAAAADPRTILAGGSNVVAPTPVPVVPAAPPVSDIPAAEVLYDSGDDTQFRSDDQVEVERPGRIQGTSGTIAFDVKPQWDESVGYADFVALGDGAKVTKLGNLLQFEIVDAGGVRHVVTTKVDLWAREEAQQIAATWDDKQLYLYVNGRLASTDGIEHPIQIADDATLRIGSSYPDGRPIAPATISRVRLRDELFVPATGEDPKP